MHDTISVLYDYTTSIRFRLLPVTHYEQECSQKMLTFGLQTLYLVCLLSVDDAAHVTSHTRPSDFSMCHIERLRMGFGMRLVYWFNCSINVPCLVHASAI